MDRGASLLNRAGARNPPGGRRGHCRGGSPRIGSRHHVPRSLSSGGPTMPALARTALLSAAFLLVTGVDESSYAARGNATRSVVYARHGMVACAQPLAAQAGLEILKAGGSAVDAAIAVNACLGLMEPTSNGMGGDLFAMVWDPRTKALHGLN